jgi:hypothetical protein
MAGDDNIARLQSRIDLAIHTGAEGAALLDSVRQFLRRFVAYPSDHASVAHTLWIAHTHLMEVWESTPRIAFLSPEPGSGKTRALEITELLVPRPVASINATPAYLFRKVSDEDGPPTILFDEIDTLFGAKAKEHEEVRGLLNAGHRRGATAGRCVVKGKIVETEELPAYCAVAIAGLGNLPDTILSRSVVIKMRRRAPNETVEPFRRRLFEAAGRALRDGLAAWCERVATTIPNAWPVLPDSVTDRNADIWEALIAVADAAGSQWPGIARVAAVSFVSDSLAGTPSLGVKLLADIRSAFGSVLLFTSCDLIRALIDQDESPWGDLRGSALDSRKLSRFLQPYGIKSKVIRQGERTLRGFSREDFFDAWQRYLPAKETPTGGETSETEETRVVPTVTVGNITDRATPTAEAF